MAHREVIDGADVYMRYPGETDSPPKDDGIPGGTMDGWMSGRQEHRIWKQGALELRPPGVMGKWEERWFILDDVSLKTQRMQGDIPDGKVDSVFQLDQIENLIQDGGEFSFTVGSRKSRIRGRAGATPSLEDWHITLQNAVERAKNPEPPSPIREEITDTITSQPKSAQANKVATSKSEMSLQTQAPKNHVTMLYDKHRQKLQKLERKRWEEQELEKRRLEREFDAIKSHTRRPTRMPIGAKDVAKTAERLFNEHRYMQQRLDEKRVRHEEQERERIEHNKHRSMPTRSSSDPSLQYSPADRAREAGMRLYGDAGRREQWRQQAKELQHKEEMSMLTVGTKAVGPNSAVMRCVELYRESNARKDKLEKARLQKQKDEKKRMDANAVPCGNGRRGPDLGRINLLFGEHHERQQKRIKEKNERVQEEMKALIAVPKARMPAGVTQIARRTPPWKDKEYPMNLKRKDEPETPASDMSSTLKVMPQTSQADYAFISIATHIGFRSGYNQYVVRPADQQTLVELLKKAMGEHKKALDQLHQDPGYGNMCNRTSQRLFQEHLLPEVEGWSHRLEPDAIRQVEDDLDTLLTCAARAQEQLKDKVAPGMPWSPGQMKQHPAGVPTALWAYDPGVKDKRKAETKALVKFGPGEGPQRHRHLVDLSRLGLVFASCDMLQVGLDHILKRFEVVDVRNYFAAPGRLGRRYVEVLVVEKIPDGRDELPHVCELRLEPQVVHNANRSAELHLQEFYKKLRRVYAHAHMDLEAVEAIAHQMLAKAPEGHRLRSFRCHLGRRFGSPVCGWRRALGGARMLSFQRLRDVCYSLHCGEHVTELWEELDPGRGGCISIWELDPESCALLTKLRTRLIGVLGDGTTDNLIAKENEQTSMFQKLVAWIKPVSQSQLELHEFRACARPLGFNQQESDKLFAALDQYGGSQHAPPATINASDIAWLKRLPTIIDTDAVACAQEPGFTMTDEFKNITLTPRHSSAIRQSIRNVLENGSEATPSSLMSSHSPRISNGGVGAGVVKAWEPKGDHSPKRPSSPSSRSTSAPPKTFAEKRDSSPALPRRSAQAAEEEERWRQEEIAARKKQEEVARAAARERTSRGSLLKSQLKAPPIPQSPESPDLGSTLDSALESPYSPELDESANLGDMGVDVEDDEEFYEEEGEEEEGEFDEDMEEEEEGSDPEGDGDELLPDNEETW